MRGKSGSSDWVNRLSKSTPQHLSDLERARATLRSEAAALEAVANRLDEQFVAAVDALFQMTGKAVVLGVGKSGNIAQKIASTLCSIGTPAIFLHPTDALHGDLGVIQNDDVIILLSKSGETPELINVVAALNQDQARVSVGILGNANSHLGRKCTITIEVNVDTEACPLNLAPMTSTTVALGIGDALATCLMQRRSFSADDFGRLHPSGNLGKRLLTQIAEVMHSGADLPIVSKGTRLKETLFTMTEKGLGAALVADEAGRLVGILTDGDLRRVMDRHANPLLLPVDQVSTKDPIVCQPEQRIWDAMRMMEHRPSQLSVLPVVNEHREIVGLVRIHDLVRHGFVSPPFFDGPTR